MGVRCWAAAPCACSSPASLNLSGGPPAEGAQAGHRPVAATGTPGHGPPLRVSRGAAEHGLVHDRRPPALLRRWVRGVRAVHRERGPGLLRPAVEVRKYMRLDLTSRLRRRRLDGPVEDGIPLYLFQQARPTRDGRSNYRRRIPLV